MSSPAPHRPLVHVVATLVAVVCGAFVAVQSRINGQLSAETGDAFITAVVSFGSGLVILAVVLAFSPTGRRGMRAVRAGVADRSIPWWYLVGGACGALFVLTQSTVVVLAGVALFTVGIVAGQILSSLLIDRSGLGTMAPKPLTVPRVAGAALALIAVAVAVSGRFESDAPLWILVAPFIAGLAQGLQQAVNGQLREAARSPLAATFISFAVGTAVLVIAALIHLLFAPFPTEWPSNPLLYLGGLVGAVFIAAQTVVVRITGVLVLGLAVLSGQVVAAAVLDLVLPVPGHTIGIPTLVGAGLTLVAVAIAAIRTSGTPSR